MVNYYKVLGLDDSLNCEELSKELKQLQRKWIGRTNAPDLDRRQEAEKKVATIEEAQKILVDKDKRAEYDLSIRKAGPREEENREPSPDPGNSEDAIDLINQAWASMNNKMYPDAIMQAREAIDIDPSNAEAWSVLGHAHNAWGNTDDAIYAFKEAIDKQLNEPSYYSDLGDIYLDLNRLDEAEEYANKAEIIDPINVNNRILLGNIAIRRGKDNEVIRIFKKLLEVQPDNDSFKRVIAGAYYNKGLEFCARTGKGNYYCVDRDNTKNMISYMEKAKDYYSNVEYDAKIAWGEEALKKKFYKPRWKWFIIPVLLLLGARGIEFFQMSLILGAMVYFNRIPQWRLTRSDLLNEKITIGSQISHGLKDALSFMKDKIGSPSPDLNQ